MVKRLPAMRETQVQSLGWQDLLERETATHSSTLAWRIPRAEEPGTRGPWGRKELDTTEQLHFHFSFTFIVLVIFTKLHLIGISEAILGGSDGEESACNAGDPSSIPGLGRPSREGNGYPFQYSWASLVAQMVKNLSMGSQRVGHN